MSKTKRLCLYLHTHWDREWYLTFEEYRTQLTLAVQEILQGLESGRLPSFMLDGQSCILEDLQEVDPKLTERIATLMAAGKIEAGPWYVLADQLLVGGESLLRNLEMGLAVTRRYGSPSMIGYCPDTFGHSQDLPRILQAYGITTAVVWRGVPDLAGQSLFWWASTDGSKVLGYHLSKGYYQTAFFENKTAENLAEHLLSWRQVKGEASTAKAHNFDAVLVPVGGDHLSAPAEFLKQLQSARLLTKMESLAVAAGERESSSIATALREDGEKGNPAIDENCLIEANSLRRFIELMLRHAAGKNSKLPTLTQELRDNLVALQYERAYMLQGVLSTRLYLKRDNRLSERRIARVLEPAFALLHSEKLAAYPSTQLNYAWRLLMHNHPHDSICGCSVDAVHREMTNRTAKFNQVLNVLERTANEALCAKEVEREDSSIAPFKAALKQPLLVEPEALRKQLTIVNLSGDDSLSPVPISWCEPYPLAPGRLESLPVGCAIEQEDSIIQLTDRVVENLIFTGMNQVPETKKVLVNQGWAAAKAAVPTFGYRRLSFNPETMTAMQGSASVAGGAKLSKEERGQLTISNEYMTVSVTADGCLKATVTEKIATVTQKTESVAEKGANGEFSTGDSTAREFLLHHKIKDMADGGDTYNFDPLISDSYVQARLIDVTPGKCGPLVASLLVKYELGIPEDMDIEAKVEVKAENGVAVPEVKARKVRSSVRIPHTFVTEIELRKSVPIVFFETKWENLSSDHRLEVFFETGAPVKNVLSENHFSVVDREIVQHLVSLPVKKGTEAPLDRYPCQRFFITNGQAFFNSGMPEFGASGSAVSLTILRAVSALSRADLRSRGGGAGPAVETPEANCLGPNQVNYGWAPLAVADQSEPDALVASAYQLAEQYENLAWTTFAPMPQQSKWFFRGKNQNVRVMAARILESHEFLELRLLNTTMQPQSYEFEVSIEHCEALLTTADGRVIEILNAVNDEKDGQAARESINYSPDVEDFLSHASYKVELGTNALASIRLRLLSRTPKDLKARTGS